ncbi:MAG: hypothetical protein KAS23_17320 [Anaerohalosphaera sp.]|nr:hypothetical protein [Anaerohalosphaera sp.]
MTEAKSKQQSEFVIHKHTRCDDVHWDLMLRVGEALLTWRLDIEPDKLTDRETLAIKIADHDLRFLKYEGPVNNGAGSVEMAAKGSCQLLFVNDGEIEIDFDSPSLAGQFILQRIVGDEWRLRSLA